MASKVIFPPIVDSYMPAFKVGSEYCRVYFSLSKFNSSSDFKTVHAVVTKQKTGKNVVKDTNTTRTYINPETGKSETIYIGRTTGIIINLVAQKVSGEGNLYYVDILNDDIGPSGWEANWIYKIQLRLADAIYDGTVEQAQWLKNNSSVFSEWSTVCIVKAIGRIDYAFPELHIDTTSSMSDVEDTQDKQLNGSTLELVGSFIKEEGSNELIHSYSFILYDENDNIIERSGEIYSNQFQDNNTINYTMKTELVNGKTYKLAFKYITINKYEDGFYKFDDEIDDRYIFVCMVYETDIPPCRLLTVDSDVLITEISYKDVTQELLPTDNPSELKLYEKIDDEQYILTEDTIVQPDKIYYKQISTQKWIMQDIEGTTIDKEEDEGRIAIKFYADPDITYSGNLCIRRADSRDNFSTWTDIYLYVARQEDINSIPIFYDYLIESGVWYQYGVQTISPSGNRGYLNKIPKAVMRNFNYSFLLGKDNVQLKLMFDNAMSNFKYQVSDSRIDPIGSQYTYIARNATTYYRTFPINGLISFWMDDDNKLFTDKKKLYKYEDVIDLYDEYDKEHNLISYTTLEHINQYDYIYERDFRDKVLEFLQDGEYKVFKSPTEGNMIVRLMDVGCTPNQSLSRMIYSFNSTAYEMAKADLENYLAYGFYSVLPYATEFTTYETKLGQLYMDFPVGTNIIKKIYEKYDSQNRNMAGYTKKIINIHHIKITFDEKPLRIRNSSGEMVIGNNFNYGDKMITVYSPISMYEFDDRMMLTTSDIITLLGDAEGKVNTVHATIDFLYDMKVDVYMPKQIQFQQSKQGISQIFEECQSDENIYREIAYKYYIDWKRNFQYLNGLSSIEIEANPGAAFSVKDSTDTSGAQTHIVGKTGQLRFYEISNILGLKYLGMQNPKTGVIEKKKCDVLVNFVYLVTNGTYKEIN